MGLVSAAGVGAQIATSLFSGALVDRVDRRRLMLACDLGRAAVYALAPTIWLLGGASLPLLYAIAVLGGALGNVFSVACMTAVPALVDTEYLHSANARLQGAFALSYVIGSMAAGAVCARTGGAIALLVDAASFFASATSILFIRFDRPGTARESDPGELRCGAGLRFLARHRALRAITVLLILLGLTGNIGVGAGITDLMIFHLKRELALGDQVVGLCMGTSALGAIIGAVSAPAVTRRLGSGLCLSAGTLVQALGLITIGRLSSAVAAAAGGLLWAAGMMLRNVPLVSFRQSAVPRELLGRVTAASWIATLAASALGTAIVTRVAASAGASATLSAVGVFVALVACAGAFGALRT